MHLVHKRPFLHGSSQLRKSIDKWLLWLKATGVESTKPSLSIPVEELKPELLEGFPLVFSLVIGAEISGIWVSNFCFRTVEEKPVEVQLRIS